MIDTHQAVGSVCEIPDPALIDMKLAAIAVMERWSGNLFYVAGKIDPPHAPQLLPQDRCFLRNLELVTGVLILAAAAFRKIRTWRLIALRRWSEHFHQARANQVRTFLFRLNARHFTRQHEGRERHTAIHARQRLAAINPLLNGYFVYDGA